MEEKEKNKKPIKPVLVVPWIDREGRAVFKTTTKEDAETLNTALDNPSGVLVKGPDEEEKVCPAEPDVPFEESVCSKMLKAFEKSRKESEAD